MFLFLNTTIQQWLCHCLAVFFVSSIFSIFVEILFVYFLPSMFKSNNSFSFLLPSRRISVSKGSRVLTQVKPPINVSSNIQTCSASAGNAIQNLLLSLWTQPLKEPAELYFRGLHLNSFCRWTDRCLNISQSIMVYWKLYILLSSPRFSYLIVW